MQSVVFMPVFQQKKTNPLNFGIDRDHVLENSKMGHHLKSSIILGGGFAKCLNALLVLTFMR